MLVVTGAWLSLVGALAAIAGLADSRRVRRLRRNGVKDWATIVGSGIGPGDSAEVPSPEMIRFSLADGRVVEKILPNPGRAGQKILVWYDPDDPADVLVYGRQGRRVDGIFIAIGCVMFVAGAAIAALGH